MIDQFTDAKPAAPFMSTDTFDRTEQLLMNTINNSATPRPVDDPADINVVELRPRKLVRRVSVGLVAASVLALAGVGLSISSETGSIDVAVHPKTAAAEQLIQAAQAQDTVAASNPTQTPAPNLDGLPLDGSVEQTWAWIDSHCESLRLHVPDPGPLPTGETMPMPQFDCGLSAIATGFDLSNAKVRARVLEALGSLDNVEDNNIAACAEMPNVHQYSVQRNGTVMTLVLAGAADSNEFQVLTMVGPASENQGNDSSSSTCPIQVHRRDDGGFTVEINAQGNGSMGSATATAQVGQ